MNDTSIIVFSKDRACQLDLCLRTVKEMFSFSYDLYVQYTSSNDFFEQGYMKAVSAHGNVIFIRENNFNNTIKNILKYFKTKYILFLTDDDVIINGITMQELTDMYNQFDSLTSAISLRMNKNINKCYPAKNKPMEKPIFKDITNGFMWNWVQAKDQHTCWGYPMAINGHIYKSSEIIPLIQKGEFKNVNSLEAYSNRNRWFDKPYLIAFNNSKVFNVQNNFVQGGRINESEYTTEYLNKEYIADNHISTETVYKLDKTTAHGTIEYRMINDLHA